MAAMLTMSESFAPQGHELHRLLEPHDQRSNDGRAAEFLQHACGDGAESQAGMMSTFAVSFSRQNE